MCNDAIARHCVLLCAYNIAIVKHKRYYSECIPHKKAINYNYSLIKRNAMDRKEIGIRIKKLREDRGFTKYRLAADAGVSPGYISDLENGKKCPTVEVLDNICFALGITLKDFFNEPNEQGDLAAAVSSLSLKQRQLLVAFLKSL